ncbi:MAG: GNAT family N-acetyltransferase [Bacteroidetes bacterium RIFOXYA12_FULL_35_11]|nr:MAG: GNAT family N-acetyltransferase [Bacteroidetes bacterium GWF2_35_48]OFY73261.1 MAG: GNAT family N-acetyltransferase [Bacteroidetes bacterium RIFOXYA12_FULL_35_11]OFY94029.1 MAG: GNAT family N-acetyltransferase [Bacteroidetes bacterium RIFOXYC12_FULL_35_7]OFY97634.1 MAG: GNAT family N-acetyltransferase [Bacteroidetes bacterium RIFOXYB2_FULL_35_7]HBX52934.1 GNAT family N-acetyltransferase [Bacteroidales bacterium]
MILLDKNKYYQLNDPLKTVTINNLFAQAVIENKVSGKVYVDNEHNPKTFYVIHPYGMSLLFGDCNNQKFNKEFRDYSLNKNKSRTNNEWMQAYPDTWDIVLKDLFNNCLKKLSEKDEKEEHNKIELNTRINFNFNLTEYLIHNPIENRDEIKIVRTDEQIFDKMKGSVVPQYFWNNASDFFKNGIGFSLYYKSQLASTAYSAFIQDNKLEIGIETVEGFRGLGLAQYACSALINYCIENNYEPIWACRLENIGSYKLALKLGFMPVKKIPYYKLRK